MSLTLSVEDIQAIADEVERRILPRLSGMGQVNLSGPDILIDVEPLADMMARKNDAIRDLNNWRQKQTMKSRQKAEG